MTLNITHLNIYFLYSSQGCWENVIQTMSLLKVLTLTYIVLYDLAPGYWSNLISYHSLFFDLKPWWLSCVLKMPHSILSLCCFLNCSLLSKNIIPSYFHVSLPFFIQIFVWAIPLFTERLFSTTRYSLTKIYSITQLKIR